MILISNDFWHKIKMHNFDPYNVLLAINTNIPMLQGHVYRVQCDLFSSTCSLCGLPLAYFSLFTAQDAQRC